MTYGMHPCPRCGKGTDDQARFCQHCGQQQAATPVQRPESREEAENRMAAKIAYAQDELARRRYEEMHSPIPWKEVPLHIKIIGGLSLLLGLGVLFGPPVMNWTFDHLLR